MTNQHPIVPSPEQVDQWFDDAVRLNSTPKYYIARQAALWSADQELEACCKWLAVESIEASQDLRTARRPKPPSLKEQALDLVEQHENGWRPSPKDWDTIRKALEALPND
jgi:hypothetical protein